MWMYFVETAAAPKPSGGYGELYGPVMYFSKYVYAACVAFWVIGAALLCWAAKLVFSKRKASKA